MGFYGIKNKTQYEDENAQQGKPLTAQGELPTIALQKDSKSNKL